jgi:hypothetical protein
LPYQSPQFGPPRPTGLTVVAVICIVLASLGLVCNGGTGVVNLLASGGTMLAGANQPHVPAWVYTSQAVEAFLGLFLDIAWIVVGIGLLRLNPWARSLAVTVGVIHIIWLLVVTGFNLGVVAPVMKQSMEQMPTAASAPANTQAFQKGFAAGAAYGGPIFGLLIGLILPVMMLIAVTRPSIKAAFRSNVQPM